MPSVLYIHMYNQNNKAFPHIILFTRSFML